VFKHPLALVESEQIGAGTRIWAFAHVAAGARIGRDCNIGDHCYVESGAVVGDEVTLKNGVSLWQGVILHDRVFVGPNVAFTNDRFPRSRDRDWTVVETVVEEGASIGANVTIVCGVRIGRYAMIGAGAVVTRDVIPHGLVYGNPARLRGLVCRCGHPLPPRARFPCSCQRCGFTLEVAPGPTAPW
jgi:UDP-2-acetamido-3-amino-2,3-dideoxy-glucuronate N-acetyltransferase